MAFTKVGLEPEIMGYAPVRAIDKVLAKASIPLSEIGWIELNEAFTSQDDGGGDLALASAIDTDALLNAARQAT